MKTDIDHKVMLNPQRPTIKKRTPKSFTRKWTKTNRKPNSYISKQSIDVNRHTHTQKKKKF